MARYTTRRGVERRPAPAQSYGELLELETRHASDDGAIILHVGSWAPTCSDCQRGTLRWAEAGYVPWHRICDVCGSHWELHPAEFYLVSIPLAKPVGVPPSLRTHVWVVDDAAVQQRALERSRWAGGSRETDAREFELLELIREEHIDQAIADRRGGVPTIAACWARRARFC